MPAKPKKKWTKQQEQIISDWRGWEEPADLRRYEKNMADVLAKILAKANLEGRADLEELHELWTEAVGKMVAQYSKPDAFRDGILYVNVLQPAVRFQLEGPLKKKVLEKVRELFPSGKVKDIKYRLG